MMYMKINSDKVIIYKQYTKYIDLQYYNVFILLFSFCISEFFTEIYFYLDIKYR